MKNADTDFMAFGADNIAFNVISTRSIFFFAALGTLSVLVHSEFDQLSMNHAQLGLCAVPVAPVGRDPSNG
jgi:hypothetical protein